MIEIDYSDPVVRRLLAVNEAIGSSCSESMARITAEHSKSMETTLQENKEKLAAAEAFYAARAARQAKPAEDPRRWPEQARRNRVLSFSGEDEQTGRADAAAPPPAPQRRASQPAVRPPEPVAEPPKVPPRPRKDRVLSFSAEDDDEGFQGFARRR